MKIKFNRNILWAEIFVKNLAAAGIKYVCISPGSRSTPLTYAFASSPEIKSFVHIDERSGAFFAGGLARKSKTPVALVCTSGTAAAEYYPGIIEAYQQRIPLIVCTADRPTGAFLKGFNQTINQHNIYKNHIRWFADAGMPDPNKLTWIRELSYNAVNEALKNSGPVHLNFPFDKPFEPDNFTDETDEPVYLHPAITRISVPVKDPDQGIIEKIAEDVIREEKGVITAGPFSFSPEFRKEIIRLSEITGYPVFTDGASQLRSVNEFCGNIITGYDALLRGGFAVKNKPGIIIHFGRTMTSKGYEDFVMKYRGIKYLVNRSGDIFDPADRYDSIISSDEMKFVHQLSNLLEAKSFGRKNSPWLNAFRKADSETCKLMSAIIACADFPDEGRIISELINSLPEGMNLMLSNSMPVRDFDYFSGQYRKHINIYHNRGASGIDGINSTALGISAAGGKTVLLTGDLAFFHDMNGLLQSVKAGISLTVVLVNNNGGGIFNMLPVSGLSHIFEKYFVTPHNIDFRYFVQGFGGNYKNIESWEDLSESLKSSLDSEGLCVLEIKTDAQSSLQNRKLFWSKTKDILNDNSSE